MSLKQKLGLDLAEYTAGWNKATAIASTGAAGLTKAVERKLGLNDVFKSFVASVGIDAAKIANWIAEKFGVGEKQRKEFEALDDLSDKITEETIKNGRARLNDEQKYLLLLRERDRLLERIANRVVKTSADQKAQLTDELNLQIKIGEIEERQRRNSKQEAEARIDANEVKHDSRLKDKPAAQRVRELEQEIKSLEDLIKPDEQGNTPFGEGLDKFKDILKKRRGDLESAKGEIASERRAREQIVTERDRKKRDVDERRGDLEDARQDRGKLSLVELANVSPFGAGSSIDAASQSGSAREALELQRKAEEARLGGRSEDAQALLAQADKLKGGLSALKSSEREDPFKQLKKALQTSEEQLADINKKLVGKFANE